MPVFDEKKLQPEGLFGNIYNYENLSSWRRRTNKVSRLFIDTWKSMKSSLVLFLTCMTVSKKLASKGKNETYMSSSRDAWYDDRIPSKYRLHRVEKTEVRKAHGWTKKRCGDDKQSLWCYMMNVSRFYFLLIRWSESNSRSVYLENMILKTTVKKKIFWITISTETETQVIGKELNLVSLDPFSIKIEENEEWVLIWNISQK